MRSSRHNGHDIVLALSQLLFGVLPHIDSHGRRLAKDDIRFYQVVPLVFFLPPVLRTEHRCGHIQRMNDASPPLRHKSRLCSTHGSIASSSTPGFSLLAMCLTRQGVELSPQKGGSGKSKLSCMGRQVGVWRKSEVYTTTTVLRRWALGEVDVAIGTNIWPLREFRVAT
ncbi:hypothetical protein CaCOL14_002449 [Colletotrichum acutatum]